MELQLKNGAMRATVTDAGAELISLTDGHGMEYIWNGDAAYWAGRNPVLFPIVGNLAEGKVNIKGETYHMGRHGFARNNVFAVAAQGENFVEYQLVSSEATKEKYPYDFDFRVKHTLHENGFTTAFTVINIGEEVLPYCVGAHTAFRCPMKDGEQFSDYEIYFPEEENCPTRLLNANGNIRGEETLPMLESTCVLPLDYAPFAQLDTLIFDSLKSKSVTLRHKTEGHGVTMEFADFPLMAFWTNGGKQAPYICIEPWMGHAAVVGESGNMEDKPYVMKLQPGESKTLAYTVSVN
jgi:galactose mutarotase-like enzyme